MADRSRLAVTLRRATPSDQPVIRRLVHQARLDPTGLNWPAFIIAEHNGAIVGVGQVRPYPNCRELGSLVVREDLRGRGIGGQIIRALLAEERGTVYLECRDRLVPYYARFGFVEIPWRSAPMPLRFKAGLGNLLGRLFGIRIAVMKWERKPDSGQHRRGEGPSGGGHGA